MNHILLLDKSGFPKNFKNIKLNINSDELEEDKFDEDITLKQKYVEEQLIKTINDYNPKLNINKIEYVDILKHFPQVKVGKYTGLIVEDEEFISIQYKEEGNFLWLDRDKRFGKDIKIYVYLSQAKEGARNSTFTQVIFPTLIEYIEEYIESPSYTISNHPIYFINIIGTGISALSLLKRMAFFHLLQIEVLEVFNKNIDTKSITYDMRKFVEKFEKDYNEDDSMYSTEYYTIDFSKKKVILDTKKLVLGQHLEQNPNTMEYSFRGSYEKFYWMDTLAISMLACRSGFKLDYSQLEEFYKSNLGKFKSTDDKFRRFETLIKFIKKITFN